MKKATLILISILLALFAFTACNNSIDYIIDDQPTDPMYMPLTLEFINAGEFWINYQDYNLSFVEYSLNGQAKGELANGQHVEVSAGDIICFFRDVAGARGDAYPVININCDSLCYVYGNVMSLFKSEGFENLTTVTEGSLVSLFSGNTNIKNHDEIDLVLPATQLAERCYSGMFAGCTKLERAPELPATQLANGCYAYMFRDCTSLTTAPVLSAETLANDCYFGMFQGCSNLTTAPELPAETLAGYCYYGMFRGCTGLTKAPVLPATTLAEHCYESMFYGCTSLTTAPELPATTLVDSCYRYMFYGCERLNSITCLATTSISAINSTVNWVSGVAATGTFTRASGTDTAWYNKGTGGDGIPSGWTVIPPMPT